MTQDLALGEVQSLAVKAARGAGRAVGQAEDAGRAVRWLSARGYDGAGALDALLHATDGTTAKAFAPDLPALGTMRDGICPLILGGYLSDAGTLPDTLTGPVLSPLLLAPFLADLAGDREIILQGQEVTLMISAQGLTGAAPPFTAIPITAHRTAHAASGTPPKTRVDLREETFLSLLTFAARTYAPATDASRESGAGAGTSDND